jgi:hypothetical protein
MKNHNGLFSIKSILPHIILIAIIIGVYYFLFTRDLFPQWIDYIYIGGKILIAFIIILASARSGIMPILTLISGLLILFISQVYNINLTSPTDAWELLIMAFIGLVITILTKW